MISGEWLNCSSLAASFLPCLSGRSLSLLQRMKHFCRKEYVLKSNVFPTKVTAVKVSA